MFQKHNYSLNKKCFFLFFFLIEQKLSDVDFLFKRKSDKFNSLKYVFFIENVGCFF